MIGYIIAIVISSVLLIKFGLDIMRGLNSRNWPTTEGKITHSGVEAQQSMDDEGDIKTTYGASIQYQYNISGQEIEGARRSFTEVRTNSSRRAEQIMARYPQGSSVTVYYHPDNPNLSILEPGVGWFSYIGMIVLLGFLVFGILGATGLIG
ncbi:MAG: DUF3592 domain-containing protein [Anaerolineales bacterium]|nr:DUF3592 domain-containing protein [Anaerolineales bacterium]